MYDLKELSKILDMTVPSLRAYVNKGKLKGKKLGVKWYVTEQSLAEYFEKR